MKQIKSFLICGLILAFTSLAPTIANAAAAGQETKATCRALHGLVQVSYDGTTWTKLRPNDELRQGATVKSGGDGAYADFQVNGRTSTVRVSESSTMTLKTMEKMGDDTQTLLNVGGGTVLGSVKKISQDSNYHVETPHGVAGIRGTDFIVQVSDNGNGTFNVTFTSKTGEIVCLANVIINGASTTVTKTLTDGQSWVVPLNAPDLGSATLTSVIPANLVLPFPTPYGVVTITTTTSTTVTYVPPTTSTEYSGGSGGSSSSSSSND